MKKLMFLATLLIAGSVQAHLLNPQECQAMAFNFKEATMARDAGKTVHEVLEIIDRGGATAGYIKDEEDTKFFHHLITDQVMDHTEAGPDEVSQTYLDGCVALYNYTQEHKQ